MHVFHRLQWAKHVPKRVVTYDWSPKQNKTKQNKTNKETKKQRNIPQHAGVPPMTTRWCLERLVKVGFTHLFYVFAQTSKRYLVLHMHKDKRILYPIIINHHHQSSTINKLFSNMYKFAPPHLRPGARVENLSLVQVAGSPQLPGDGGKATSKSTTTSVVVFVVTKLLFLLGKKVGQFSPKLWGTFVGEFQKMFKNFTIFGRESRNFKIVLHYNHYNFPKKIPLKKKSHEIKNSQSLQVMGTPPPQGGYLEIWAGPDMKISLWRPSTWSISSLPFAHF